MTGFLDRHRVLDPHQFVFRAKHSTVHLLMLTKDFIQTELQKKNKVVLLSLDLKKAFDHVKLMAHYKTKFNITFKIKISQIG